MMRQYDVLVYDWTTVKAYGPELAAKKRSNQLDLREGQSVIVKDSRGFPRRYTVGSASQIVIPEGRTDVERIR